METKIKSFLIVLGFEVNIQGLPKLKEVMKKYYSQALLFHSDSRIGGDTVKFQKLEKAIRVVGEFINGNSANCSDEDEEDLLAKDLFSDIISQFNQTKENKNWLIFISITNIINVIIKLIDFN